MEGKKSEGQGRSCYYVVKVLKKNGFNLRWIVSALHATGVLFDYFIVYTVKINDDDKCVVLNRSLGFTALAFRWLLEILNTIILCTMFDFRKFDFKNFKDKLLRKETMKYMLNLLLGITITRKEFRHFLMLHQFLSIFLVAVVCQVMILISLTSSRKGLIVIALYYLVALHLPRLNAVTAILLKRPTTSLWLRPKFLRVFLFVFVYSIQLFAATWYLPAVHNETQCWIQAYKYHTNSTRDYYVFNCNVMKSQPIYNLSGLISDYCYTNTNSYEFGIYAFVHKSGILRKESSLLMILYFSRWALQHLSSFAQGLEASVSVWQNFFIILIIIYAVFMFFFLIGEVQSEKEQFAKSKTKLREKRKWMAIKGIPERLQCDIEKDRLKKWRETNDIDIENMFNNLPENLRWKLSQELCLERLRKVTKFEAWNEASLKELCNYVKPVFYTKCTQVIREGDSIDEMVFVLKGELWIYPSMGRTIDPQSSSHCSHKSDYFKNVASCGEELFEWVQTNLYSSDYPISRKTIQAVPDVEAFVIIVHDLKKVFIQHKANSSISVSGGHCT